MSNPATRYAHAHVDALVQWIDLGWDHNGDFDRQYLLEDVYEQLAHLAGELSRLDTDRPQVAGRPTVLESGTSCFTPEGRNR